MYQLFLVFRIYISALMKSTKWRINTRRYWIQPNVW